MFCPDGYVTLHACQHMFRDIARERWEKERPEFRKIMKTTRSDIRRENEAYDEGVTCDYVEEWEKPETTKENWEIASYFPAFRRWATTFLVVRNADKIWACSPQGQITRPSHDLFHTDGDVSISFSLNGEGFAELEGNQARFSFLDEPYFTINSAEFLPPYVPELTRRRLQPFAGWSICWKPKNFDNWQQELHEIIADLPEGHDLNIQETAEPGKHADETTAVEKIVGEPQRLDNWQQGPHELISDTFDGRILDVQVMKRHPKRAGERRVTEQIVALFDANNQVTKEECRNKTAPRLGTNAFARAWRDATELRLGLSKAGRRAKKSPPLKPAQQFKLLE